MICNYNKFTFTFIHLFIYIFQATRCITQCCHTMVMTHHPFYNNNAFTVHADVVKLGDDIPKEMSPQIRVQMKDFPISKMDKVIPFEKGTSWYNNNYYGTFGYLSLIYTFKISPNGPCKQPPKESLGQTTSNLIEEAGDVTVLGLKEYEELL